MKEYKAAILGLGFIGRAHVYGYETLPLFYELPFKVGLEAVCSRTLSKVLDVKDKCRFNIATDNEDEIFANKEIDIVNICTPNAAHKGQLIKALNAKKHIYCEKPVVLSDRDIEEVLAHPNLDKVVTQTVFHNRFFPSVLRAKQIIDEGRLGKVLCFRAQFLCGHNASPLAPVSSWVQSKASAGGGALVDIGSHILDMVYHLLGSYEAVYAKTQSPYNREVDDAAYILATLKNGATGTIEASKIASGNAVGLKLEINGDKGALMFDLMEPNWLYYFDNTVPEGPLGGLKGYTKIACIQNYEAPSVFPRGRLPVGWLRGHVHSLYTFVSAVHAAKQGAPSLRDGLYVQRVINAIYRSSEQKKEIAL